MRWFFPQYCGDFRLVEVADSSYREQAVSDSCVLEVVDPTAHEVTLLEAFLADARANKWTPISKIAPAETTVEIGAETKIERRQSILLGAPLAEVGKVLYARLRPGNRTITAVRSESGVVQVFEAADLSKIDEVLQPDAIIPAPEKPKTETLAVSAQRPTPSCPQCVPGAVSRASEVLLSFLSAEEHKTWAEDRFIIVEGGLSGNRYMLAHRHSPYAVACGRICYDLDEDIVVHFHDNSVPPEEEVLAAKLILEHRESWLRNEATLFHAPWAEKVFKNPFGGVFDGVEEAGQTQALGATIKLFLG